MKSDGIRLSYQANFTFFDAILSGTVFLVSSLDSSLLVYRNATGFCVLTFYPATLIN